MTVSDTTRAEYEQIERANNEGVARAVEAGGLPSEQEAEQLFDAFQTAFDQLEGLEQRIRGIAQSYYGDDIPPVTLEQLGAVALVIAFVEERIGDFQELVERIRAGVSPLDCLRHEQAHREEATT